MTRSTFVAALWLALAASACQDANSPDLGQTDKGTLAATVVTGVVTLIATDGTTKLALSYDGQVLYLTGKTADLAGHIGQTVTVTGAYRDDGMFVVDSFSITDVFEKKGGGEVVRVP